MNRRLCLGALVSLVVAQAAAQPPAPPDRDSLLVRHPWVVPPPDSVIPALPEKPKPLRD